MRPTSALPRSIAVSSLVVLGVALTGCADPADDASAEVRNTSAQVADRAKAYLGDPWEQRLRQAHAAALARSYTGDPWETRAVAEASGHEHVHDSWEGRIPGHEDETRCPLAP